jgi:hypothetical protein
MSSVITGLAGIRKKMERPKLDDGPRARWLKVEDGQSVKIRFINELDPDSPSYDASRGLAIVVAEHTNPKDYRRKGVCTIEDEGRCFGCEQYRKDPKSGWKSRLRFYINALVDDGAEKYVAVFSQGVSSKSPATTMLIEYAGDTQSISNLQWRLKRSGTGTQTSYALIPLATDTEKFDWSEYEPFDLEKVAIRSITYPEQESFYMGVDVDTSTSSAVDW